ncbi:MAG: hypothetical protein SFX18_14970, partial [Pirellulales bacterium]|nr:hypothetical protein [Pirellulales bacterium]
MPIQFDWVTSLSGCFVVFGAVVFAIAFMDRRYHEIPSKYLIVAARICNIVCNKYDYKEYTLLYNYEIGSMKYSGKSNSSYINDEVKEWAHLNIYVNPDNHKVSYTENDIIQLKKMNKVLMFLGAAFRACLQLPEMSRIAMTPSLGISLQGRSHSDGHALSYGFDGRAMEDCR